MEPMVEFDIAPVKSSIIMCIGVGGGGGNAVRHMFKLGIADVTFVICNTDHQALEDSPIPNKIRLGDKLTGGLGAGNKPERGKQAALESIDQIKKVFEENETKMLFVTAGMGGGTGTGAAPVIAKAAKEMGILTVAIVSIPFKTEGRKRIQQAIDGIEEIINYVDSLLVVDNESINEIHGDLTLSEAFGKADDILATAAKSIADIITSHFKINVDFEDVKTVMQNSGVALMGSAQGSGDNRALEVAAKAMSSPLLNHKDISGAQNVLLNITSGTREVTLRETYEITEYIQERSGNNNGTDLIWGAGQDESLEDDIRITVIATGFGMESIPALKERYEKALKSPLHTARGVAATAAAAAAVKSAQPKSVEVQRPAEPTRQTINLDETDRSTTQRAASKVDAAGDSDFSVVIRERDQAFVDTSEFSAATGEVEQVGVYASSERVEYVDPEAKKVGYANNDESFSLTTKMSDNDLDVPAYIRRGMKLGQIKSSGSEVARESLDGESAKQNDKYANTIDLFEQSR